MAEQDPVSPRQDFTHIFVWPDVPAEDVENFVSAMQDDFGTRVQFLEQFKIFPARSMFTRFGRVKEPRTVVVFAVHDDDWEYFDVKRKMRGIRSLDDVLVNNSTDYPPHLERYKTK